MSRPFKYSREQLEDAVGKSTSISGVLVALGLKRGGGSWKHVKQRITHFGIDTAHFTGSGWAKGKRSNRRRTAESIFVVQADTEYKTRVELLRRALLETGVPHECAVCGQDAAWNGQPLTLQVDHINGNNRDHSKTNLRFICPNCHSQTGNFAGKANGKHPAG